VKRRRRTALWLLGVAGLAIGAVLLALDGPMWDAGGPGIVGFELAGSAGRARDILVEWGGSGRDAARLSLWIDFAYLAVYGAFWALAAAAVRDLAARRGRRRLAAVGAVAVWLAPAAAACDAVEDVNLLLALGGHGGSVAPPLAAGFASAKFLLIGLAIGYVLLGLAAEAFRRFPRAARAVAAALVVGVPVAIAANAWAVEHQTEA
jgi:hypothetical protein